MSYRILACTAVLGLAAGVQADFVRTVNTGSFELVSMTAVDADYTFLFSVVSQIGGLGFTGGTGKAHQVFTPAGIPDDFDGVFVLEGASPLDTMTVSFDGFLDGPPGASHASWAGTAIITGATGAYAGLVGVGDLSGSHFFTAPDGGLFDGVIQLDVIPTPGSAVLLGAAGLMVLRRRR